MITLLFICVIIGILLFFTYFKDRNKYGHIPGPMKLPFLGNIFELRQKDVHGQEIPFHQQVTTLSKKYGDVMWMKIGFENIIVLSSYEAVYEALVQRKSDFADKGGDTYRSKEGLMDKMIFGMRYCAQFKAIKQIVHRGVRMYGENVDLLENVVNESLDDFVETLQQRKGKPILVIEMFREAFANTIHILVFGRQIDSKRSSYSSMMKLNEVLGEAFSTDIPGMLLDHFPALRFLFRRSIEKVHQYKAMCEDFWSGLLKDHLKNWDGEEQSCLLDMLLKDQKTLTGIQSGVPFSDEQLYMILDNLFLAGFLTSGTILTGVILQCVEDPKIQDRIYSEVCKLVGPTGRVCIRHRQQLHYTRAVIFEALRNISLAALGGAVFRKTTRDTEVRGYFIPKGTEVAINQWAVHHDGDFWADPWAFRPERFLNADGTLVDPGHPNRKRLLPFGAGERVCVAEVFALNRLVLFLCTLVQRFHFKEEGTTLPSADTRTWDFNFLVEPPQFHVRFVPRE